MFCLIFLFDFTSGKCYIVLQSHTKELTGGGHAAAIAVSVDEPVFIEV